MSRWAAAIRPLLPHHIICSVVLRFRFERFAKMNGLVYFGLLHESDDHEPVRGFTANAGQVDTYVMHGSIHGREITVLERTIVHTASPNGHSSLHSHTWLITTVKHTAEHAPHVLLLSHEHPRLHDEAVAIHHSGSKHVPLEYRLDASFLAYAKPSDAEDFRIIADEALVQQLLAKPWYDYELDSERLYVYSHHNNPRPEDLNQIVATAILVADAFDGDIEKSPL